MTEYELLQDISNSLHAIRIVLYFIAGTIIGHIAARLATRNK